MFRIGLFLCFALFCWNGEAFGQVQRGPQFTSPEVKEGKCLFLKELSHCMGTVDLDWLKSQGHNVERYNLAQQPRALIDNTRFLEYPTRNVFFTGNGHCEASLALTFRP